jgi:hypothetical protein
MKIVVNASGTLREEFLSRTIPLNTRIAAVESVSCFPDHPDASIFFDLEPLPEATETYRILSPAPYSSIQSPTFWPDSVGFQILPALMHGRDD